MPANELNSAIAILESRLAESERKATELKSLINRLYEEAGQPQKYPDVAAGNAGGSGSVLTQIKRDSFYGKKQMTAIREYLEMRRAQGNGPGTPREIFDALKAGGYAFATKSDHVALVGLRAVLRKGTTVFHKLPGTGTYGLMVWYPDAKKTDDGGEDGAPARKGSKSKARPKAKHKAPGAAAKGAQQAAAADSAAAPEGK
jgi:hypothetical protein